MKKLLIILSVTFSLVLAGESVAIRPGVSLDQTAPGPTPFISFVTLRISDPVNLSTISFSIRPKQGSKTRPISATYSSAYLQNAGYFQPNSSKLTLPVFGLYQGRQNTVTVTITFNGGATQQNRVNITTAAYVDGTFTSPTIVQPRSTTTTISYDYILMKASTTADTPVIIDSDAEVRWVGSVGRGGQQALFYQNGIYSTDSATSLVRLEFDGRSTTLADYASLGVTGIHHNFDYGRDGILIDVDTAAWLESINMEVDGLGNVLRTWNLADIISAAMVAGGDDPSGFVFPAPTDWFHNNATTYRPSDDSFIVSSRENFVIALDYDTQAIKWILGATDKHWYQYRSLRKFALKLGPDTLAPVGQHAVSIVDDNLLLFDNGTASLTQMPTGMGRTYSAPRKYAISGKTATEIYHYLSDPATKSSFCSSVYEDATDNYLIDYAQADGLYCDIVGLDASGAVAFYFQYVADGCGTAFNANPLHLENLQFD
ncbi:MAG: aryl-sulfate sulfotransferase [Chthoniobacterales bacterium]|nr:aryl-sulfate sulfotransferase [Chthoniobacterales bacterium]